MLTNELTQQLNIQYPIIQAPMAGGVTTSALVASVSNNGGLGMIGAGYMRPEALREQIHAMKQITDKPFGVNIFIPNEYTVSEEKVRQAVQLIEPIENKLRVQENSRKLPDVETDKRTYEKLLNVIIEESIPVCSFTFGLPTKEVMSRLKRNGTILIGTATTVKEAIECEKVGMDMVVVQGSEAGGHRGNFRHKHEESLVGLMSLIPQVVDKISIPVIAAGGIMDGRGLMAAICLGAKAVQMGTAFLTSTESGANPVHKDAILHATEDQITLTAAFSGKWARGINNQFIKEMDAKEALLPDFPVQNTLTQSIRKAASSEGNQEYMSLWSGQSPRLAKKQPVSELINHIIHEAEELKFLL
ncbi:NAD(P)H-dependent flavin oxidoreductase [Oceanobacillus bengalensis]|uniref:Probable nitronate monooxygenase n=1 Tax=Oceanobacillus bengalensis TaxID=1435466 RepID=A0A494YUX7_9BACI|nr:nitronate monooxygenase [Oceanobacillus bengalensis]RKQ13810.1 nitronate monooxygenase [Oceanobacillus bengalensis]